MKKMNKAVCCLLAVSMFLMSVNFCRADDEKSPIVAGLLSWVIPGLGQYYNGRPEDITKGLIIDGVFVGGLVLVIIGVSNSVSATVTYDQYGYPVAATPATVDTGAILAGVVILAADGIFGIVDAVISADDINKHHHHHSTAQSNFELKTALLPVPGSQIVPGLQSTFNF